jgi:hypothetical protein
MHADMLHECSIRLQGVSTLREGAEQSECVWVHAMRTSDLLSARDQHGEATLGDQDCEVMLGGPKLRGASADGRGTRLG